MYVNLCGFIIFTYILVIFVMERAYMYISLDGHHKHFRVTGGGGEGQRIGGMGKGRRRNEIKTRPWPIKPYKSKSGTRMFRPTAGYMTHIIKNTHMQLIVSNGTKSNSHNHKIFIRPLSPFEESSHISLPCFRLTTI